MSECSAHELQLQSLAVFSLCRCVQLHQDQQGCTCSLDFPVQGVSLLTCYWVCTFDCISAEARVCVCVCAQISDASVLYGDSRLRTT